MPAVMGKIARRYPVPQDPVQKLREKVAYRAYMGTLDFMPWFGGRDLRTTTDSSKSDWSLYRRQQAFRAMFSHDAVKAPLLQKIYSVSSLDIQTTAASESPRDTEIADFVKYQFTDAVEGELPQVAESILLPALLCKNSICEKVWNTDLWPRGRFRGKRFLRTIKAKENAKLVFDDFRNVIAVEGRGDDGKTVQWSPKDFIIFRHLPLFEDEGTSDLEAVYDLVWKLDTIEKLHDIHLDKFTSPTVKATYQDGMIAVDDEGNEQKIQDVLQVHLEKFKSRSYIMAPEGVVIEALQLATRGEAEFLAKCEELRQRIALALCGAYLQFLAQVGGQGEMRGASKEAKSTAELFVWALAAKLASVLNTQATPGLVEENYAGADYPKISLGGINYGELAQSIVIDEAGQRMGAKLSVRAMSRKYGWQLASDPSDVLAAPPPPPTFGFSEKQPAPAAVPVAVAPVVVQPPAPPVQPPQDMRPLVDAVNRLATSRTFAEPKRAAAIESSLERQTAHGGDIGIAGADGRKAEKLLQRARDEGAAELRRLARAAVARLIGKGRGALKAKKLFDPDELSDLADQITNTNAPAELLGRARVREREQKVIEAKGTLKKFSEQPTEFHAFDEKAPLGPMTPQRALDYFRGLISKLGVDPERWGPALERQAFTLAAAADLVLLNKIKDLIADKLATGDDIGSAPEQIDALLDEAGVGQQNGSYSEMLFRTNMLESYNKGAEQEGLDVADTFPVWRYANPDDGRSRSHHAARNGNYYPNKRGTTFTEVRGTEIEDVAQCRCTPIFVDKYEWEELEAVGAKLGSAFAGEPADAVIMRDKLDRIEQHGFAMAHATAEMAKGVQAIADKPFPKIPAPIVNVPAPIVEVKAPIASPPVPTETGSQIVHRDSEGRISAIQSGNQWKIFHRDEQGNIVRIERTTTEE